MIDCNNIPQSEASELLVHFWEMIADDLAVEFSAAAQGLLECLVRY